MGGQPMNPATEQAYKQIIRQQQETIRQQRETIRLQAETIRQQQARIAELEQLPARLTARVAELSARVEELSAQVARLSKNSCNSSKPPSSDIVKPPKPPTKDGRKRHLGGQPGHPRHERAPFTPDQINQTIDYRPDRCPDAIHVGWSMRATLSRVRFEDIDIIHTRGGELTSQLAVDSCWWGDPNTVIEEVHFKGIRMEDVQGHDIVFIRQVNQPGVIRNITFTDVDVIGGRFAKSRIFANDAGNKIQNVTFTNLRMFGRKVTRPEEGRFLIDTQAAENIVFK